MLSIINFLETNRQLLFNNIAAPMAELADALDLGSSSERSTGSIPATRTKMKKKDDYVIFYFIDYLSIIRFDLGVIIY